MRHLLHATISYHSLMSSPKLQQGFALPTQTAKSLQPQRRKGHVYCNEWTWKDSVCKPKTPPTGITTDIAPLPAAARTRCYTHRFHFQAKQVLAAMPTAQHNCYSWHLSAPSSPSLPTKQQRLFASWFIPPPYVQLSVCMTIKNKATYIMALKQVTNQLHPLSYDKISIIWLPRCAEKGKCNQTTWAMKWCRALVTGSRSFLL